MPRAAAPPRPPTLLLLGLLAMLLWGQCAALLFPGADSARELAGFVASTDSLRSAPATLYLTLGLRNNLRQPVVVYEVEGQLLFSGQAYPFSATAQLHHTPLAPGASLRQAVAIRVPLPADSLALLRQALQTDYLHGRDLQVEWQTSYATKQYPEARTLRNMQPYLPTLKPTR